MKQRIFLESEKLQPGMQIDQYVVDRMDRILVQRGILLDAVVIQQIRRRGITGVFVLLEVDGATEAPVPPLIIPDFVKEQIATRRKEDPEKVDLSAEVKKRISKGIEFLYNNSDSSEFFETSNRITSELLSAIDENNALAVDISMLKTSDEYTFKHSVDVATMSMICAKKQGLSNQQIKEIGIAGLLHDMGKSKVPPEILNKSAKLTKEEFELMKKHPIWGYEILKDKPEFQGAISIAVLQHHEKCNGSGYPFGVFSSQIHPYAKIITVTDIYDALVTDRPYKKSFTQREAVEIILSMTEELDVDCIRSFMETVILYPVDSIVTLSNGEKAQVIENHTGSVLRPTVIGLTTGKIYNLSDDISCASLVIQ